MKKDIYIGIDPDISKSGVAIYNAENGEMYLKTMDFFNLMNYILVNSKNIIVCIESGYLNRKVNFHRNSSKHVAEKIAMATGVNHAVGILLYQLCEKNNIDVIRYVPKKGQAKMSADDMSNIVGTKIKSNPETRDAFRALFYSLPIKVKTIC
ncbi:MAG: hypothetical protein JXR36_04155 [Bacteroidales bacterium]|nr:hypothetical protein [Bacteroidales bacterium]